MRALPAAMSTVAGRARQRHRLVAAEQGARHLAGLQAHLRVEQAGDRAVGEAAGSRCRRRWREARRAGALRGQRGATLAACRRCAATGPAPAAATRRARRARPERTSPAGTGWRRSARTLPVAWPPAMPTSSERDIQHAVEQLRLQRQTLHRPGLRRRAGAWRRSSAPRPRRPPGPAAFGALAARAGDGAGGDERGPHRRSCPRGHRSGAAREPDEVGEVGGVAAQIGADAGASARRATRRRPGEVGGADPGLGIGERDPTRLDAQLRRRHAAPSACGSDRRSTARIVASVSAVRTHAGVDARLAQQVGERGRRAPAARLPLRRGRATGTRGRSSAS